ncbi:efflux RND transporter periplasmic adaptor subunit [Facilibium subflavum]|uniref:efflux RND transporter periplasmic adaptor subunit n=1 Tax=Facilibium subflavum TaxID=2219058 RepID=UPI000E64BA05|nr:efflux RND transporter periplasmic adaptor subunit [Facilibium subflavum]
MADYIKNKPSKKKLTIAFAIVIAVLVIIFGGIFGFAHLVNSKKAAAMAEWKMQPAEVTSTTAKVSTWHPKIQATGQAIAIQSVNVTTQVSGLVSSISFKAGEMVKKGQELFRLDTTQLQAELDQAKAQMQLAQITYQRDLDLYKKNAISQQNLDQSKANYDADKANVASIQANIDYHIVKAPFTGKIGLRQISLGQYFKPGDNAATLTELSPIFINFPISQNDVDKVHVGGEIEFTSDAYPGKVFKAKITAVNSEITDNNRAINVQATYENTDKENIIYPGMFLDVSVILPALDNIIILPRNAISYTLYGETVIVLKPVMKNGKQAIAQYSAFKDGKAVMVSTGKPEYIAQQVPVKTSITNDNKVIVDGIKANDIIATSGQNKLQNGSSVVINNEFNFKK